MKSNLPEPWVFIITDGDKTVFVETKCMQDNAALVADWQLKDNGRGMKQPSVYGVRLP